MITNTQRRNQILRRISRISSDKLKDLEEFVSKLEKGTDKKTKITSFAGAWKDIDDSIFEDFTTKLIDHRSKNRHRINE